MKKSIKKIILVIAIILILVILIIGFNEANKKVFNKKINTIVLKYRPYICNSMGDCSNRDNIDNYMELNITGENFIKINKLLNKVKKIKCSDCLYMYTEVANLVINDEQSLTVGDSNMGRLSSNNNSYYVTIPNELSDLLNKIITENQNNQ